MFKTFNEWFREREQEKKNEMTASSAASGGMTSTADIANYARPLFGGEMVRRKKMKKN